MRRWLAGQPFITMNNSKKVFVGLSGGVDSSVSAALLKEQGYDVTGVFIKAWYPDFLDCDWKSEKRDAMRICAHLSIPFKMLDLADAYKRDVIDYMIREYGEGRTPNPDVMCNKHIKFGGFYAWARAEGADYVATGHYAQVGLNDRGEYELREAADKEKDQTYFIWNLTQEHLAHTLFPIGKFQKADVRKLAHTFGLFTESKKDSQGLCFLGDVNMRSFLRQFLKTEKGAVLDGAGTHLGTHDGAILYTIGERIGFTADKKTPHDAPFYVIAKDMQKNTVSVSTDKPSRQTRGNSVQLSDINQIVPIESGAQIQIRTRYRQTPLTARLTGTQLEFLETGDDVAAGQSIVFYRNGVCLGGGIVVD